MRELTWEETRNKILSNLAIVDPKIADKASSMQEVWGRVRVEQGALATELSQLKAEEDFAPTRQPRIAHAEPVPDIVLQDKIKEEVPEYLR